MSEKIDLTGEGKIFKEVLKAAEEGSPSPSKGQQVYVHYEGRLLSGKIFDSSYKRGEYFDFELGAGQVIKGWDLGVASMKKGEKARFTIDPDFAYGKAGAGKDIPPNATLEFDVELFEFDKKPKSKHDMNLEEKIQYASDLKAEGNVFFKNQNFEEAVSKFKEAHEVLKEEVKKLNEEQTNLMCICLTNSAICYNKLGLYESAIKSASTSIIT